MKKINIVKENRDFSKIMNQTKPYRTHAFLIFVNYNTNSNYRFGISISKKIGNAVVRNKLKRQIKDIIDKKDYQNNFDCIIILKEGVKKEDYHSLKNMLDEAFKHLHLYKGDVDENKKLF